MSLARNTFVQVLLTLASRILGFARDLAANYRFGGQSPLMDAFATALMFPNLFRRLFAEGAFAQAFVPIYAKERTESGPESADRIASEAMSFLLLVVALFCIAAQIAMPWLMPFLLSYMDDPELLRMATLMTQLTMPYLVCMTVASLLSGVLNTAGRFALSAGVPTLLNVCTIAALFLAPDEQAAAVWVSVAVTVSGVLQAGLLWWGARRIGANIRFGWPKLTPAVRKLLLLAVPGALAGGATQINSLVSQFLSGTDPGARSVLYNADRLYQLPLGLIGVAVGLALVPRLSRHHLAGETEAASTAMDDAIGISMALTVPAALAFMIMPFFIIDATVTRGAFTSDDAARTAEVLRQFAWGVPAFVLAKVFTPPFFARQDTKRPMQFAITSVIVNTLLGAGLFFTLPHYGIDGVIGLGFATSAAGWLNVVLLSSTLAREGVYKLGEGAKQRLMRLAAACAIMGAFVGVCAMNYQVLADVLWRKEAALLAVAGAAFTLYAIAALALRAVTVRDIRGALKREAGPPPSASGEGGALPPSLDA